MLLCVNAYAAATKFICLNCENSEPAKPAPVLSGARTLIMIAHHGMTGSHAFCDALGRLSCVQAVDAERGVVRGLREVDLEETAIVVSALPKF